MKILHILYSGLGGTGNVFFSFVKADENKKKYNYEAIFAGVEQIREEYVLKSNAQKIDWKFILKKKRLDITFNRQFIQSIKQSPSSIILLHGSRFIVLAKIGAWVSKNKKKIVVAETQSNQLKTKMEWMFLAASVILADKMVFLTEQFRTEIKQKFKWLYVEEKTAVINNGLDLSIFKPAKKPADGPIVLGMQSRIIPIKDHVTLLHAYALFTRRYPEISVRLKIAGDGSSLPALRLLITRLQIIDGVEFTGMLNEEELIKFLQSLDVYIHASFGETMSTSIMQAMACRLPIIASDVPGINNMIQHNISGILVPVKNEEALANAISELISNPAKINLLKNEAFNFAILNYSNKTMFAKYETVFEQLIPISKNSLRKQL